MAATTAFGVAAEAGAGDAPSSSSRTAAEASKFALLNGFVFCLFVCLLPVSVVVKLNVPEFVYLGRRLSKKILHGRLFAGLLLVLFVASVGVGVGVYVDCGVTFVVISIVVVVIRFFVTFSITVDQRVRKNHAPKLAKANENWWKAAMDEEAAAAVVMALSFSPTRRQKREEG